MVFHLLSAMSKLKRGNIMDVIRIALSGVFLVMFVACTHKGNINDNRAFVKKGEPVTVRSDKSLLENAKVANKGQYKIVYKNPGQQEVPLISELPVGAIIPFYGQWNFSDHWQIAMGQTIKDPESPLHGMNVPDLIGAESKSATMYLAGTIDKTFLGKVFGKNELPPMDNHTHSEKVKAPTSTHAVDRNSSGPGEIVANRNHSHKVSSTPRGKHDHGGDNRPVSFGLVYLIKVK